MRLSLLSPALLALAAFTTAARAQELLPSGTGFQLAASATVARSSAESQGITTNSTRMAPRIELSYGATPRVALVGAFVQRPADIESQEYRVRSVDLGVRYLGGAGRAFRPFAEGGLAVRKFTLESEIVGEVNATDVGPWVAAGYQWLAGGHLAFEGAATFGRVSFKSWKVRGTAAALAPVVHQEVGVRAGVRWLFRAR